MNNIIGTIEDSSMEVIVEIKGAGPQGEKGDPGEKGEKGDPFRFEDFTEEQLDSLGVDKHYIHNQIKSSNVWTIQHNLDKYPSVIIVDSSNNAVIGDIVFIDKNSLIVSFMAEFSGKAYLN